MAPQPAAPGPRPRPQPHPHPQLPSPPCLSELTDLLDLKKQVLTYEFLHLPAIAAPWNEFCVEYLQPQFQALGGELPPLLCHRASEFPSPGNFLSGGGVGLFSRETGGKSENEERDKVRRGEHKWLQVQREQQQKQKERVGEWSSYYSENSAGGGAARGGIVRGGGSSVAGPAYSSVSIASGEFRWEGDFPSTGSQTGGSGPSTTSRRAARAARAARGSNTGVYKLEEMTGREVREIFEDFLRDPIFSGEAEGLVGNTGMKPLKESLARRRQMLWCPFGYTAPSTRATHGRGGGGGGGLYDRSTWGGTEHLRRLMVRWYRNLVSAEEREVFDVEEGDLAGRGEVRGGGGGGRRDARPPNGSPGADNFFADDELLDNVNNDDNTSLLTREIMEDQSPSKRASSSFMPSRTPSPSPSSRARPQEGGRRSFASITSASSLTPSESASNISSNSPSTPSRNHTRAQTPVSARSAMMAAAQQQQQAQKRRTKKDPHWTRIFSTDFTRAVYNPIGRHSSGRENVEKKEDTRWTVLASLLRYLASKEEVAWWMEMDTGEKCGQRNGKDGYGGGMVDSEMGGSMGGSMGRSSYIKIERVQEDPDCNDKHYERGEVAQLACDKGTTRDTSHGSRLIAGCGRGPGMGGGDAGSVSTIASGSRVSSSNMRGRRGASSTFTERTTTTAPGNSTNKSRKRRGPFKQQQQFQLPQQHNEGDGDWVNVDSRNACSDSMQDAYKNVTGWLDVLSVGRGSPSRRRGGYRGSGRNGKTEQKELPGRCNRASRWLFLATAMRGGTPGEDQEFYEARW
ncbi:hypothetical protein MKZ38_006475 [Zalerion maritima]|uniref:Uncharacterized protein n=1 Tax=Zalerion maritima TaxID=339359 RepID=A0AAD5WXL0_9PEZI|nr:hypothetical protein MKZ38_006475 [Zalerion maritima]